MGIRQVKQVRFKGEASDLHAAIGRWNVLKGVGWRVTGTDYVGNCFDVTFERRGDRVTAGEAKLWVERAIKGEASED